MQIQYLSVQLLNMMSKEVSVLRFLPLMLLSVIAEPLFRFYFLDPGVHISVNFAILYKNYCFSCYVLCHCHDDIEGCYVLLNDVL